METRVKELMQERGLRASDVAARVGQPVAVVSNELSRGLTSVPSVAKYARALRVPVWELLHRPVVSAMGKELAAWSEPSDDKGAPTRIGAIMRERGLTQLQVAERMGAIRQNVNKWVTSTKLNLSTLQSFATALEIDAEHLYLMFISQEEYDAEMARRSQPTPAAFDPHDPSPIQTVTEPYRVKVDGEEPLGEQVNVGGSFEDLFAQIPEEPLEVQMQEGVTYVCGNTRITIVNGVMEIRVQDKKAI